MKRICWLLLVMAVLMLGAWGCGDKTETTANTPAEGTEAVAGEESTGPKVDINMASVEDLDTLKGVSPKVARAIVKFREEHNGFTSVEQLNEVKGISDALLAKLQPLVMCGSTVAPATGAGEGEEEAGEGSASAAAGSEGEAAAPAGGEEGAAASGQPNINTATAAQIKAAGGRMALATAEAIVAAREEAGGAFTSWEQVDVVPKVGASTLEKLQAAFSLGGATGGSSSSNRTASSASSGSATSGGKVNLNTATAEQIRAAVSRLRLETAEAIVEARNALPGKKFRSWEQVDAVPGVGASTLTKLKETCTI